MISNIPTKYFVIFVSFQILTFFIVLGFIGIDAWSQEKINHFVHHKNNFNLSIDKKFEVKYLDLPQRKEIVFFVMTAPESSRARSVIRRTWGKILKPFFVLSKKNKKFEIPLENESKVFNDLIVIDEDVELTTAEKLFVALNFFKENFSTSRVFMISRDDEFINPKNLYEFLNQEDAKVLRKEISAVEPYEISLLIMPGFLLNKMDTLKSKENFIDEFQWISIPTFDLNRKSKIFFILKNLLEPIFPFAFSSYKISKEISFSHRTPEEALKLWEEI